MPINRAKFLKGQRFDLQVEVKGVANNFKVTVDGVMALTPKNILAKPALLKLPTA